VSENADLPNVVRQYLDHPDLGKLNSAGSAHKPRVLLFYGSLRERSYSRFLAQEAQRILHEFGAETRMFNPSGLPAGRRGGEPRRCRSCASCPSGRRRMSPVSPERHGNMTGIMKTQIDWLPLAIAGIRLDQGRTLAVMQVSAGPSPSMRSITCGFWGAGCA